MPISVEFTLSQAYSTLLVSNLIPEFGLELGLSVEFSMSGSITQESGMDVINEGTTATLTMDFKDENGIAISPDTGTYLIYDKFSGTEIRSGSVYPLATSVAFSLLASDNALQNAKNRYEIRVVYIEFTYGARRGSGEYSYKIENLAKTP